MEFSGLQKKKKGQLVHNATIVIGGPGNGKSTFCLDWSKVYMKLYLHKLMEKGVKPRAFIHDPSDSPALRSIPTCAQICKRLKLKVDDPIEFIKAKDKNGNYLWKSGAIRYLGKSEPQEKAMYLMLADHVKDCFVWFDEATNYIDAIPASHQRLPVVNRRNYGWEVFYSFHALKDVPVRWAGKTRITKYVIFRTGEGELQDKDFKRFLPVWWLVKKAYNHLRKLKESEYRVQQHYIIDTLKKEIEFCATLKVPNLKGL